ncbi:hypothetical protein Tco_1112137, partial [Tanacetum coccineum]
MNPVRTLGDYSRPSHEGYRNTIELPKGNNMNDLRDFAKPVKAITLPQDVSNTSNHRHIELKNQVQRLMKAHLALTQPTQVNKVTTLCKICSAPHDTQYCMEDPKQAFVEYASSRTDEEGGLVSEFMASQDARLSKFKADFKRQKVNKPEVEQEEDNPKDTNSNPYPQPDPLAFITTKQEDDGEVMFIKIIQDDDEPQNEDLSEGEWATTEETVVEYFNTFPTRNELTYH